MITINDIARMANVSKSTVSRVINNYPDVNEKTKKRIIKIMKENHYWPNTIARSLTTNKSYTIGMFVPTHLNHFFFREVIEGIEFAFGEMGYDLLLFTNQQMLKYDFDTGIKLNYLEQCLNKNVDGVIMLGFNMKNIERFNHLINSAVPTVFIDLNLSGSSSSYLMSNNFDGARQAVYYLNGLGHQKIAFFLGPEEVKPAQERLSGFQQAFRELQLDYRAEWIFREDYTYQNGSKMMQKILAMKNRPSVIFGQDIFAVGAIRALRAQGYSVPGDFSVMGFDNIEIAEHYNLTSVNQQQLEMGKKSAQLLLQIINQEDFKPIVLPVEIVERNSCKRV
ncbi:MAG: LacI family transcriptional regulator [Halanaerobiales bacterium]|nr:LacI family transcriptional regulator [Halanaerobiales bacterium]